MRKPKVVPIRLSVEDLERLQQAALASGRTVSGFIRHAALTAAARDSRSHPAIAAARREIDNGAEPDQASSRVGTFVFEVQARKRS